MKKTGVKKAQGKKAKPHPILSHTPVKVHAAIAPPSLPMRHDHPRSPAREVCHPEVRLVVKTHYMEQKPHVLLIESGILAAMVCTFFGLLLYLLHISPSYIVPILSIFWVALVILLYKFFED